MARMSRSITIFEGPDGGGKTTAAKTFAKESGAAYIHMSAMPLVTKDLGRLYIEAMLPALLGYQDVVLDRCWLSEAPYGAAFREGRNRLTRASCRMLERVAMRCGAVVVKCMPGWGALEHSFRSRAGLEMLDNLQQLRMVYDLYKVHVETTLPVLEYNYTTQPRISAIEVEPFRMPCHPVNCRTVGNMSGDAILVESSPVMMKDGDSLYQWPFVSFNNDGCSQWLTDYLRTSNICESEVLWASSLAEAMNFPRTGRRIITFESGVSVSPPGAEVVRVTHPQQQMLTPEVGYSLEHWIRRPVL